ALPMQSLRMCNEAAMVLHPGGCDALGDVVRSRATTQSSLTFSGEWHRSTIETGCSLNLCEPDEMPVEDRGRAVARGLVPGAPGGQAGAAQVVQSILHLKGAT